MSLRINTNIAALDAYRNLSVNDSSMQSSLEKLSSGLRINKAADDAAGLSISENLTAQIGGLTQAGSNAQDGVNVVQTADGALNESENILQRMRNLAVQSANGGSQDTNAQAAAQTEFGQLQQALDQIAKTTSFGGQKLLAAGTTGNTAYQGTFQVGANNTADDRIQVNLDSTVFGASATAASFQGASNTYGNSLQGKTITATLGSGTTATVTLSNSTTITSATDVATQLNADSGFSASFTASSVNGELKIVDKATGADTVAVSGTAGLQGTATAGTAGPTATGFDSAGLGVGSSVKVDNTTDAQSAITSVDNAIKSLSTARAELGAYQNRFEHTINNLSVETENLTASKSNITDTDMAAEMVKFTRSQILSQAGTAMLAQANQIPQSVLKLLQ